MTLDEVNSHAWIRFHDSPALPVVPAAPVTIFPHSLADVIEICSTRPPSQRIHAAGSHWALSDAAISDHIFVETHDPHDPSAPPWHAPLGRTLRNVVPGCLNKNFIDALAKINVLPFDFVTVAENEGLYPVHIETGKRIYQLYAELDFGDDNEQDSLAFLLANPPPGSTRPANVTYNGPWAFRTLGGAGGQTVFGALTTGTHGGDFRMPPIADDALALHLVVDGGMHFWIEPASGTPLGVALTDDALLHAEFGKAEFGGPTKFDVIRNDDIFNAVLVSAGRFGIVYSVVLAAVRQYCLQQSRTLTDWQTIRSQITNPKSPLFVQPAAGPFRAANRFLQVAVSVTPHDNFTKNLASVTKRFNVPLTQEEAVEGSTIDVAGRPERRGQLLLPFDPSIMAPRFQFAGNNIPFSPDPSNPEAATAPSFLELACSNANFMVGVLQAVDDEISNFINSKGNVIGGILTGVTAPGGGSFLTGLLAFLLLLLALLKLIEAALQSSGNNTDFGQVLNGLQNTLLNRSDPSERAAGLLIWQMIAFKLFSSQQENLDYAAISYAVMDQHDYTDKSCSNNADSIEVFFDATDPMLPLFVDGLLAFEIGQETAPTSAKAFVGYISLRFTGPTRALLGEQRFPVTCAVEVAGLRDVAGTKELIDFALTLASAFGAIAHWGQRNPSTRQEVESHFGDTLANQSGNLHAWRQALSVLTQNGRLDGFSSAFTRQTGLEIATPLISLFTAVAGSKKITVTWNCSRNPPATVLNFTWVTPPPNSIIFNESNVPLVKASSPLNAAEPGIYLLTLTATLTFGGESRVTSETRQVTVT